MTSAFLTPLALGAAQADAIAEGPEAQSILINGFGIIAFISVTPLIAVQALGIIYDRRLRKEQKLMVEAEIAEIEELINTFTLANETKDNNINGIGNQSIITQVEENVD